MEFSFRIMVVAILAFATAVILIMVISGMSQQSSQAFRGVTDWLTGIVKKP